MIWASSHLSMCDIVQVCFQVSFCTWGSACVTDQCTWGSALPYFMLHLGRRVCTWGSALPNFIFTWGGTLAVFSLGGGHLGGDTWDMTLGPVHKAPPKHSRAQFGGGRLPPKQPCGESLGEIIIEFR